MGKENTGHKGLERDEKMNKEKKKKKREIECKFCDSIGYVDDEYGMPDMCSECDGKGYIEINE